MAQGLRVLLVASHPTDAEWVLGHLRNAGYAPVWQQVEDEAGYLAALNRTPEIIIADFQMPNFPGMRALKLLRELDPAVPLIFISEAGDVESAVEAMKGGATDYLLKDCLGRLGDTVRAALGKSRERIELQQLVDHSPVVIYSLRLENGEAVPHTVSGNIAELLGVSSADACDPEWWRARRHPDDLENFPEHESPVSCSYRMRHRDGHYVWVEDRRSAVRNSGGEVIGFSGVWIDITERRRIEDRFRRLVDSNVQGVFFRKDDGSITDANDAALKILGYTREDLNAGLMNWRKMTPPEYAEGDQKCFAELVTKGICRQIDKEYYRKDGSRVPVLIGVAAYEDKPDEGVSFVVDLTERKKLEQQLLRSQRMEGIGSLAGGIAHDFNNVLAPIMMALSVLKNRLPDKESQELLGILRLSAQHGQEMVRQVLLFAAGGEGHRKMTVSVRSVLLDLERIVSDTFLKLIRVEAMIPKELWSITGDSTQLQQVLLNLCVNARDAMADGGTLTIDGRNVVLDRHSPVLPPDGKPGNYVVLSIGDNGCGMPAEVIEQIFDPYFTTKGATGGSGLGLPTSLGIVKSHGGFIRIHSEPRLGTLFSVYLPANEQIGELTEVDATAEPPVGQGECVLVVDDEESVREVTRQTLEAYGYRVKLAANGAEAIAIFAVNPEAVDVVLTDMMMPVMDGAATIKILRRIAPNVRVIAASGLPGKEGPSAAVPDVADFLAKPFTADRLLHTLRDVLGRAPANP